MHTDTWKKVNSSVQNDTWNKVNSSMQSRDLSNKTNFKSDGIQRTIYHEHFVQPAANIYLLWLSYEVDQTFIANTITV